MPINTREIIDLLSQLAEEDRLRVTVTESLKAGIFAALATVAGGLLGGRRGLTVGGVIGGCAAALVSKDFLSVVQVIASMEEEKKEMLAQNIRCIMAELEISDVAPFTALIAGDIALRNRVVGELIEYLKTEMSMAVVDY